MRKYLIALTFSLSLAACHSEERASVPASIELEIYDPYEIPRQLGVTLKKFGLENPQQFMTGPTGETLKRCRELKQKQEYGVQINCMLVWYPEKGFVAPDFNFVPGNYHLTNFAIGDDTFTDDDASGSTNTYFSKFVKNPAPAAGAPSMIKVPTEIPGIHVRLMAETAEDYERPLLKRVLVEGKAICIEATEELSYISPSSDQALNCTVGKFFKSTDELQRRNDLSMRLVDRAGNSTEYLVDGGLLKEVTRENEDGAPSRAQGILPNWIAYPKELIRN